MAEAVLQLNCFYGGARHHEMVARRRVGPGWTAGLDAVRRTGDVVLSWNPVLQHEPKYHRLRGIVGETVKLGLAEIARR